MKTILCCDGGGVRGIATVEFLTRLEEKVGPLCDYFDMFCGTSIGALITSLICVNKLPMKEIQKLFTKTQVDKIFDKSYVDEALGLCQITPKYSGKGKKNVIREYSGCKLLGDACKPFLVTSFDTYNRRVKFFKSYREKDIKLNICDILDASSAAPAYFPSKKIGKIGGHNLIDGGVVVNNPAMCAYADAKKLWEGEDIKILSVGTGSSDNKLADTKSWGGVQWITNGILDVMTDQSHVNYQLECILGKNYLRIDSKLTDIDDTLDNTSQSHIDALRELGNTWWSNYKTNIREWLK